MTIVPNKVTAKTFDCISFKRQAQAEIYEAIKGMTRREQIEYFRREVASDPIMARFWQGRSSRSGPADSDAAA